MEENKSPKGNLPSKAPVSEVNMGTRRVKSEKYNIVGDIIAQFFQDMEKQGISLSKFENVNAQFNTIMNKLDQIDQKLMMNKELLEQIKEDKPRVIVRKEKA
jgi:predicted RNase H-like nuclease